MKVYLLCSLNDKDYMDPEFEFFKYFEAVSYTHLTLPTIA